MQLNPKGIVRCQSVCRSRIHGQGDMVENNQGLFNHTKYGSCMQSHILL